MTDASPFDPARFRGAAAHYLDGRPNYAPALIRDVALLCGLDGSGQLLDLGCGPGQLAAALRPFVASALGMDPEPEMLALATSRSAGLGITFRQGAAHDLAPGMGPFRLATIGRAFHWMDRPATLRMLDRLIEPGGAVVLFETTHPDLPDNRWRGAYQAVIESELGAGKRQVWRQPGWVRHDAVLLDSAFAELTRLAVTRRLRTPAAQLVHRAMSMSATARAKLGDAGVARLAAGVRAIVDGAARDGLITEVVDSVALIARRP